MSCLNHHLYKRRLELRLWDFRTCLVHYSQQLLFLKEKYKYFFLLARSLCDSEMRLNEICWRVNHTLKLVFCLETDSFGKPFYQYLTSGKCTDSSTILTRPLFRIPFMFNNNLPKINSKCYHSWLCLYNKLAGKEE